MKIIDISRPLNTDTPVYKNREIKKVRVEALACHEKDNYHESTLHMNLHTGTHIDAPLHMIAGGEAMSCYDLSCFFGRCKLFDLSAVEEVIEVKDIEQLDIEAADIVLFKTKNSDSDVYDPKFVYLSAAAAKYLVKLGIKTLGIDAMSVERGLADHPAHMALLTAKIPIIEELRFSGVVAGSYNISCLPIALTDSEAASARAILWV